MTTINGITLEDHCGLVWSVVQRYAWACGNGLESEDLFQEGMLGLERAAEGFDPSLGFRFSTYALHWIRQSVRRAIDNQSRVVRIPVHKIESMRKRGERPPRALSLDMPDQDGGATWLDNFADPEPEPSPVYEPLDKERIAALLDTLPEREREIIRARFWAGATLSEVGYAWGITRERVRQLQNLALTKLRETAESAEVG